MSEQDPNQNPNKEKYIIDPYDVQKKDYQRIAQWCLKKIKKYEGKLGYHWNDRAIIASGAIEPEEVDVRNVYPFKDLAWFIYRDGLRFSIMLTANNARTLLFKASYAKI